MLGRYNRYTRWSTSILHTLIGFYDKNKICTKKMRLVYVQYIRDISSKTVKLEIQTFLNSKKLN